MLQLTLEKMTSPRSQVIKLYKTLLYMGRDYPLGYNYFRDRCHRAFLKNRDESEPEKVQRLIGHGEFVVKELTALYSLKKYRTMKRRYYPDEEETILNKFKNIQDLPSEFDSESKPT